MEPGYKKISIRLKTDDLTYAKGKVATANGYIEVNWQRRNDTIEINLTIPAGCEAVLALPRIRDWHDKPVEMEIDGQKANLTSQKIALCTFLTDQRYAAALLPGTHKVMIRTQ